MPAPRLGAASLQISISDAEGLKVLNRDGSSTLVEIPADKLERDDWLKYIWSGIENLQMVAATRSPQDAVAP